MTAWWGQHDKSDEDSMTRMVRTTWWWWWGPHEESYEDNMIMMVRTAWREWREQHDNSGEDSIMKVVSRACWEWWGLHAENGENNIKEWWGQHADTLQPPRELMQSVQTKSSSSPRNIPMTRSGDLFYTDDDDSSVNIVKNTQWSEYRFGYLSIYVVHIPLLVILSDEDKQRLCFTLAP